MTEDRRLDTYHLDSLVVCLQVCSRLVFTSRANRYDGWPLRFDLGEPEGQYNHDSLSWRPS